MFWSFLSCLTTFTSLMGDLSQIPIFLRESPIIKLDSLSLTNHDDLNKVIPKRLIYLNAWLPVDGTINWERLGGVILMEEMPREVGFEVLKDHTRPWISSPFCLPVAFGSGCMLLTTAQNHACLLPHSPPRWAGTNPLKLKARPQLLLFISCLNHSVLSQISLYSIPSQEKARDLPYDLERFFILTDHALSWNSIERPIVIIFGEN